MPNSLSDPAKLQRPRLLAESARGAPEPQTEIRDRRPADRKFFAKQHPAPRAEPDRSDPRDSREDCQHLPGCAVLVSTKLDAPGKSLGVCRSGRRVLCALGRTGPRREAAQLLDVVDPKGNDPEERRESEEEDGPGDGTGRRDAEGALLVEAVVVVLKKRGLDRG